MTKTYYNNDISQWMDRFKETGGVYGVYFSLKRPRISREERKNIISFLINKENDLYVIIINWKADCKQAIDLIQSGHNL